MTAGEDVPGGPVLYVAIENVFNRDEAGGIWARDHTDQHWTAQLAVFNEVRVVARVADAGVIPMGASRVESPRISFAALPEYKGLAGFARVAPKVVLMLWAESRTCCWGLVRLPGAIGTLFGLFLAIRGKSFGVQVVGDLDDVLATRDFPLWTRLTRRPLNWLTRYLCRATRVISYVTRGALQRKYPCGVVARQFSFANVDLEPGEFAREARVEPLGEALDVVFCGTLSQQYKGLDVLIDAARLLNERGIRLQVSVAGEGRFRASFTRRAADRMVAGQFRFLGQVPRASVLELLATAGLFVLPSRTEGLPRALVEAMAKGLPCIASRVGGIPELLCDDALVPPNDPVALAGAIERFVREPGLAAAQARRNLLVARRYSNASLDSERIGFARALRALGSDGRLTVSG